MAEIKHSTLFDGRGMTDLPYPGGFEIVTWQLNVTTYESAGTLRWSSTLVDPRDQVRIHKGHQDAVLWSAGRDTVLAQCEHTLEAIQTLQGLRHR